MKFRDLVIDSFLPTEQISVNLGFCQDRAVISPFIITGSLAVRLCAQKGLDLKHKQRFRKCPKEKHLCFQEGG